MVAPVKPLKDLLQDLRRLCAEHHNMRSLQWYRIALFFLAPNPWGRPIVVFSSSRKSRPLCPRGPRYKCRTTQAVAPTRTDLQNNGKPSLDKLSWVPERLQRPRCTPEGCATQSRRKLRDCAPQTACIPGDCALRALCTLKGCDPKRSQKNERIRNNMPVFFVTFYSPS